MDNNDGVSKAVSSGLGRDLVHERGFCGKAYFETY